MILCTGVQLDRRMRLLVSVSNAAEASAALAGGADVIDAKDPLAGALGAVSPGVLREIYAAVAGTRPVTAALGDAARESVVEADACTFAVAGARLVKIGFAGIDSGARVAALIAAGVRGAAMGSDGGASVVAVAYADADRVGSIRPESFISVAARAGARGVLLDTADKSGPGLRSLMTPERLTEWVAEAHAAGVFVALAGKLIADDLAFVNDAGADIAGVRGAACEGGRNGRISTNRVTALRTLCERQPASAARTVSI
jgi:(5-formylfuran-3-yl)methyl phosphate synthase